MKDIVFLPWASYYDPENSDLKRYNFLYQFDKNFWTVTNYVSYPRYGKDIITNFFAKDETLICSPTLGIHVGSFADITDSRSTQILNLAKNNNKELIIFWSGGTDSTVILTSLLKNWPKTELDRVTVYLNSFSYYENPSFFSNFVLPNFKYILFENNALAKSDLFSTYNVINGDPADKLWLVYIGIEFAEKYGYNYLSKPWKTQLDTLKQFIYAKLPNLSESEIALIIDRITINAESMNGLVETVGQLLAWIDYNFYFSGHCWSRYFFTSSQFNTETLFNFKQCFHLWYNTKEYQQWAWSGDADSSKNLVSLMDYKMPAKQYIYELTKNEFDMFKTKMPSHKIYKNKQMNEYALFKDGSCELINSSNYATMLQQVINFKIE